MLTIIHLKDGSIAVEDAYRGIIVRKGFANKEEALDFIKDSKKPKSLYNYYENQPE